MNEKQKFPSIYKAREIAGKPFCLTFGEGRLSLKPNYTAYLLRDFLPFDRVFGRLKDEKAPPWDPGNFEIYDNSEWHPDDWNRYEIYEIAEVGEDGKAKVAYGRVKSTAGRPWDESNFEVLRGREWVTEDFEAHKDAAKRKSLLGKVKTYAVQFQEPLTITVKGEQKDATKANLETTAGLFKAIDEKLASKIEDGNDPKHYWLTIAYNADASPQEKYSVAAKKMTEQEVATYVSAPTGSQEVRGGTPGASTEANYETFLGSSKTDDLKIEDIQF